MGRLEFHTVQERSRDLLSSFVMIGLVPHQSSSFIEVYYTIQRWSTAFNAFLIDEFPPKMRQLCHLGKHLPNLQVSLTKYITVAVLGGEGEKNPSKDIIVNPTIGIGSYFGIPVYICQFICYSWISYLVKRIKWEAQQWSNFSRYILREY